MQECKRDKRVPPQRGLVPVRQRHAARGRRQGGCRRVCGCAGVAGQAAGHAPSVSGWRYRLGVMGAASPPPCVAVPHRCLRLTAACCALCCCAGPDGGCDVPRDRAGQPLRILAAAQARMLMRPHRCRATVGVAELGSASSPLVNRPTMACLLLLHCMPLSRRLQTCRKNCRRTERRLIDQCVATLLAAGNSTAAVPGRGRVPLPTNFANLSVTATLPHGQVA